MKAYTNATTPKADKDEQETPPEIFERVQEVLGITFLVDVAASAHNTKIPDRFWDKSYNSLSFNWCKQFCFTLYTSGLLGGAELTSCALPCFWMNPPYSMLLQFTAKAAAEARKGCIVVGLVPDMPSSRWYQHNVHNVCPTVYRPDGRVQFLLNGEERSSNPLPSCFPVWTPWRAQTTYQYFSRKPSKVLEDIL